MNKAIMDVLKKKIDEASSKELEEAMKYLDMVDIIREQAKKEVFDDIDELLIYYNIRDSKRMNKYQKLKKKHLTSSSTDEVKK